MTLSHIAWGLLALDALLLLIWLVSVLVPFGGSDAAGRGLGEAYTFGLGLYLLLPFGLMFLRNVYATAVALVLAALPILLGLYGMVRWLRHR